MATQVSLILGLLLLAHSFTSSADGSKCDCSDVPVIRGSFPSGFIFGAAGAAYQFEGAYNINGKGQSMWDNYTHTHPERIADRSNGDVAVDSYHRYKDDVCAVNDMGLDAYRFSISWSRILPDGMLNGGKVNPNGIEYYNNLINDLLAKGKEPFVTMFHFDIPQAAQDYGGLLNPLIVEEFRYLANISFYYFGDRVKYWTTLNEPWSVSNCGYSTGTLAPGRCSNSSCTGGNSATEPYWVTHYQLLAHAHIVKLYREKYQETQKGKIGITLVSQWFEPFSNSSDDQAAQKRALDFMLGWFMDPITFGDYPQSMRSLVGSRLPNFTSTESKLLIGSFDFLGLNYYTTLYAANAPNSSSEGASYNTDSQVYETAVRNGVPIGEQDTGSKWIYIYPKGIEKLVVYIKKKYNDPPIYITENGVSEANNSTLTLFESLMDKTRKNYIHDHLCCLLKAINNHDVNIKGYFAWSLLDNFEWGDGYTVRFGLYYVAYNSGLARYPKHSAIWFKSILQNVTQESQSRIFDQ